MNETKTELKEELKKSVAALRTLRDEVRVKIHLAGLDAKTEWNKLEPHLLESRTRGRGSDRGLPPQGRGGDPEGQEVPLI